MSDEEIPTLDDERLEKLVLEGLKATSGRVLQCAHHAFHHLERAGQIVEIDPEMAMFRAITAEEEAATAVFFSLRQRRYANADKIQFRSHQYKAALYPFVMQVRNFLASVSSQFPPIRLRVVEENAKPHLIWEFKAPDGRWGRPDTPFNFLFSEAQTAQAYHFERQLEEFAQGPARGNVKKYIDELANTRNLLLYADESGRPGVVGGTSETLKEQRRRVVRLCLVACMIAPYKERALFVQQTLNAFLVMMGKLDQETLEKAVYTPEIREGDEEDA
jgi:hypothetical protein